MKGLEICILKQCANGSSICHMPANSEGSAMPSAFVTVTLITQLLPPATSPQVPRADSEPPAPFPPPPDTAVSGMERDPVLPRPPCLNCFG